MDITKNTVMEFVMPSTADPQTNLQDALETGNRAVGMLFDVISSVRNDVRHGENVDPNNLLHKIIGLAHKHNLPTVREKALEG
jgi:hypothetical protein